MENTVLITGVTSGLGKALAYRFAKSSRHLILVGRNRSKLKELESSLNTSGKITSLCIDLKEKKERSKLLSIIAQEAPDLVINNAGMGIYGFAVNHSVEDQAEILEVNGNCMLEITLTACKTLKKEGKRGKVLNVSSVAGFIPYPSFAVYSASKGFVTQVSQALDYEMRKDGIRILTFCPGKFESNFGRKAAKNNRHISSSKKMGINTIADAILNQLTTEKQTVIYNWKYQLILFIARYLLPKQLLLKIMKKQYNHYSG